MRHGRRKLNKRRDLSRRRTGHKNMSKKMRKGKMKPMKKGTGHNRKMGY